MNLKPRCRINEICVVVKKQIRIPAPVASVVCRYKCWVFMLIVLFYHILFIKYVLVVFFLFILRVCKISCKTFQFSFSLMVTETKHIPLDANSFFGTITNI